MVPGLGVRLGIGHRIAHPLMKWLRAQVLDLSEDAVVVEDKVGRPFQGHSQVGLRVERRRFQIRNMKSTITGLATAAAATEAHFLPFEAF